MPKPATTTKAVAAQPEKPSVPSSRWMIALSAVAIVLAALAAYHNSFSAAFVFDDYESIFENQTIRHLWPVGRVLLPPRTKGFTVAGRPLVNLSLAVNYALGGVARPGYHVMNLTIHILAGLTLFGVVRRTLRQPRLQARFGPSALPLALAVAVLWTVHPLQTETVTYVVQRAESLMGLFYLLTLYCFIRGAESRRSTLWFALSVVACLLGMATKEVMVSAPLLVLLYDRTFVAGSFAEAWRRRRRLYLGLAATWLLLVYLVAGTGNRGGTVGFGIGMSGDAYLRTQCWAITRYLWLSVWPRGLVFEYGEGLVTDPVQIVPCALILIALLVWTVRGLWRRPCLGFLGACFFMILAPSSSVIPVASQPIAEHRMYLPLAAVIALVVLGIHALLGKRSAVVFLAMAVGLGFLTTQRNEDYRSELSLWTDTMAKRPNSARAHNNLGAVLAAMGRMDDATMQYMAALQLNPRYAEPHNGLGNALLERGKVAEAIEHYLKALQFKPDYVEAHNNLGNALLQANRTAEAIAQYREVLRLKPDSPRDHYNLGNVYLQLGNLEEAKQQYEEALRLEPDYAEARYNLGNVLQQAGQPAAAIEQYQQALRLLPDDAQTHNNLGSALQQVGKLPEAREHYEQALRLKPDYARAHNNLGLVLYQMGRVEEARAQYEEALRLEPDYAKAHNNLGIALLQLGKVAEARAQYEEALRLQPDYPEARKNLADLEALSQTANPQP